MNFEEAFRHYKEGTASAKEREYVEDEIAKAKALSSLLDDDSLNVTTPPVAEAEVEEIKTAKKEFKWKSVVVALCSVVGVLVAVAAILGGVFGSAASYAKKNMRLDRNACIAIAVDKAYELFTDDKGPNPYQGKKEDLRIDDVDTHFHFETSLDESYYSYRIEVKAGWREVYIDVNTINGSWSAHFDH